MSSFFNRGRQVDGIGDDFEGAFTVDGLPDDVVAALWDTDGLNDLGIYPNDSIIEYLSPQEARRILGNLAA